MSQLRNAEGYLFLGHGYTKCRTQGSIGKMYKGKTYTCWSHENLTTQDGSVKKGRGSCGSGSHEHTDIQGPID